MRRRPVLIALGGLGAVLTMTILAELVSSPEAAGPPAAEPSAGSPAVAGNPAHPESATDWKSVLLARPPFNPRRRPEASPTAAASTTTEESSSDLPRLAGILISHEGKHAIFQGSDDDKPIVVGEGDQVDGWTVQQIAGGGVTMVGPNGSQTLQPKFDPNAKPPQSVIPGRPPIPPNMAPSAPETQQPNQLPTPPNRPYLRPPAAQGAPLPPGILPPRPPRPGYNQAPGGRNR